MSVATDKDSQKTLPKNATSDPTHKGEPNQPRRRPSLGRPLSERGLDLFDTPPIALAPLFTHEPHLMNASSVCEPFAGKGNLVTALRERGRTVYASDIRARSCPDSTVQDFFTMAERPPECRLLLSNPPFARAMETIEHALDVLKFDVPIFCCSRPDFYIWTNVMNAYTSAGFFATFMS